MKRTPVKSLFLGVTLAMRLLLFTEASLAADTDCRSDSGIPSSVIAPIDVGHLRKSLNDAGFTVGGFYLGETFGDTGSSPAGRFRPDFQYIWQPETVRKNGAERGGVGGTNDYQLLNPIKGRRVGDDDFNMRA
jgi:hypothetical protein